MAEKQALKAEAAGEKAEVKPAASGVTKVIKMQFTKSPFQAQSNLLF